MKNLGRFLTGLLLSVALTVVLVLIFALFVKWFSLSSAVISPVNRALKVVAIFTAVIFFIREKGLLLGSLMGAAYILATSLLFGALSGGFILELSLFLEMIFGVITGALSGVISVNLNRKGA